MRSMFHARSQIMALPRGATAVDFAYAIHSDVGDRTTAVRINDEQVPLRTELKNSDVVEVITADDAKPTPAWLAFVRTGRARSKIRHYVKTLAQNESADLGEGWLTQALRSRHGAAAWLRGACRHLGTSCCALPAAETRAELMTDIGLGKRIASIVAKRLVLLLSEDGQRPDALLLTRERYGAARAGVAGHHHAGRQRECVGAICQLLRPVPGDPIVGYLGAARLVVHHAQCAVARKLQNKDGERFIAVDWADEPARAALGRISPSRWPMAKGVLARIAAGLPAAAGHRARGHGRCHGYHGPAVCCHRARSGPMSRPCYSPAAAPQPVLRAFRECCRSWPTVSARLLG